MPVHDVQPLLASLAARSTGLRDQLIQWAEINSGSDNAAGLARMLAALKSAFGQLPGTLTELPPGPGALAPTLSIRCRATAPVQVLLSGHYDTVYRPEDPFQKCRLLDDGTLNGPGVADMKGGLVILLAALTAFEQHPDAARLGWEVLLNADEETGSIGSRAHLIAAAGRHQLGLVFEPSPQDDDVTRTRKGVGTLTVTARGRAAHAGQAPAEGRNAIVALAEFIGAADRLNQELPGVLVNVGRITGGGAVNIVPDTARTEINIRTGRAADGERLLARLREIAATLSRRDGFSVEMIGGFNRPPKEELPAEGLLFAAYQSCARELGVTVGRRDSSGGSDANFFSAAGLPVLDGLGVDGDHLHCDREFCHLDSLGRRARLVALFLMRLADGTFTLPRR